MKGKLVVGGVIVAVLTVIALVVAVKFKSFFFDQRLAVGELQEFLGRMYPDKVVLGHDCVGRDTDGDGYVSCNARVRGKDEPEETLSLECASDLFNNGCKTRAGVIKVTR